MGSCKMFVKSGSFGSILFAVAALFDTMFLSSVTKSVCLVFEGAVSLTPSVAGGSRISEGGRNPEPETSSFKTMIKHIGIKTYKLNR